MRATDPKRIAYLTSAYPTISHTFILREVQALRELGFDVRTASIRRTPAEQHPGPDERDEAARTFNVLERVGSPAVLAAQIDALKSPGRYLSALGLAFRTRHVGFKSLLYQGAYFFEATILARWLRREAVAHLHAHFAQGSTTVAMLAAQLAGIPFSFTLHGPSDLIDPARWHLGEKVKRARFVSTISHYARSQIMLVSDPADWDKIRIVHCGVQPVRYAKAPGIAAAGRDFIFVGRLAPVKGWRVLLEAFGIALERQPGLTLTIVGDGPDRAAVEAAAARFRGAVRLTGAVSQAEVARLLGQHRAMVLPSFAEGVPVVLMEAMASGRPVIATRITGVPELVEDGVSGLLIAPGDIGALTEAMLKLAAAEDTAERMGVAGRAAVAAEFVIAEEAARLARLIAGDDDGSIRPEPLTASGDGTPP